MKKLPLLFALLIAFSFAANAQMKIGVKAGLNLANMTGDVEDNSMKIGYQVGAVAEFSFGEAFAVQPGLLLSNKGMKVDNEFLGKYTVSTTYLEIPINAVYTIQGIGLQVYAGPYVGVGLFGKVKPEEGDDLTIKFVTDDKDVDAEDQSANLLDFGLNFGVGYKMMDDKLQIQAGYGLGLSNTLPKTDGKSPDDSIKNGVIQLNVSFFF